MDNIINNVKLKSLLTKEEYDILVIKIKELINRISQRQLQKKLNISKQQLKTIIKDENIDVNVNNNIIRAKKAALSFEEREKAFAESLHAKDSSKIYYSGFTNIDSKCFIKCLECGAIYEIHCQAIRHKNRKKIYCARCEQRKIEERHKQKELKRKELKKIKLKEQEKIKLKEQGLKELETKSNKLIKGKQIAFKICANCGKYFIGNTKYCSQRCRVRQHEHIKTRKRIDRSKYNGDIDKDITLDKLIQRDNNICYICGLQCDNDDYYYKDNFFIAGNLYPSIDHVIPIAKGGTHTWDNIKLAHRYCNSIKSDKTAETVKV